MNKIETQKIELRKLFSDDYFFKVPSYQRPFSWEDQHYNQLLDDLLTANQDQEYFLGTIVLHFRSEDNTYDIVDGQQRLTTLLILLAVLRDLISDKDFKDDIQAKIVQKAKVVDGIPEKIRLEVKDTDIFNELVKNENGTLIELDPDHFQEPKKRYIYASKIFHNKLNLHKQPILEKLVQFLSQKCIMILLSTSSFDDAFRLFTIVNDRGKQLRRIDILKALNLDPSVIPSETSRNRYSNEWEVFENNLGETNFESLLYLIRSIILRDKMNYDLIQEFDQKIFGKRLLAKGSDFFDKIFKFAKTYCSLFSDYDFLDETDEDYFKFNNLIFLMEKEFKASEWKACILLYVEKYGKSNIYKFLVLIERLYLYQWVQIYRKDDRTKIYNQILEKISNSSNSQDIFSISEFSIDINELKECLDSDNFYDKSYCKYVLLKLEYLSTENISIKRYFAKTVEHILPQSPKEDSEWLTSFTSNEINNWTNRLANLILLSKSKNSAAQNFDFNKKKEKYFHNKVSDFSRSLEILTIPDWETSILEDRQKKAIDLLLSEY